jgi:hypothetical protein
VRCVSAIGRMVGARVRDVVAAQRTAIPAESVTSMLHHERKRGPDARASRQASQYLGPRAG